MNILICKICNKETSGYKHLATHISKVHKIKTKDYYDSYLKKKNEGICLCGKNTAYQNMNIGYLKFCSIKCSKNCDEVNDKYTKTMFDRYGAGNPSQVIEFQEKRKNTWLINTGFDHPMKCPDTQLKNSQTWKDHTEQQKIDIRIKTEDTNMGRYGGVAPLCSKEIQEKQRITNEDLYGGPAPYCSEDVRNKGIVTCRKNNDCDNPFQAKDFLDKSRGTCFSKYDVDSYSKTFEFRKFMREQMIKRAELGFRNNKKFSPNKGDNELPCIFELRKYTPYFIDNDSVIIGYFPDGYIKELNIVIEFDEPFHSTSPYHIKRDIQKDLDYERINLRVLRIKESDWLENKEKVINDFLNFLNVTDVLKSE